jgi:hypothetical protein
MAAVLLGGHRLLPAVLAAAVLINTWSSGPTYVVAATSIGAALETFIGCILVNRLAGGRNVFAASTTIAAFVLITIFSTAIYASIGAAANWNADITKSLGDANWRELAAI